MQAPLADWNGSNCITERLFRYNKCISWIRLYIHINDLEFCEG